MSLPIKLPDPPVFYQTPSRCWAAAYASWNIAQNGKQPDSAFAAPAGLAKFFDDMEIRPDNPKTARNERIGEFTVNNGAIRHQGLHVLALFGLMSLQEYKPNQVNAKMVGEKLRRSGYIWCVYKSLKRAHAVVIFGASHSTFDIMNPLKGLVTVPLSEITGNGNLMILLGEPVSSRVSAEDQAAMDRLSVPFRKPTLDF